MKKRHEDTALRYIEVVPSGRPAAGLPLVVVLHGRGADSNDLADLAPAIAAGTDYRFVLPDAPQPFEAMPGYHFGYTWFTGWPAEPESFRESRRLLLQFIHEMYDRYNATPEKTVLCGFSQGGMMCIDVGFRLEKPAAGIVVMSGAIYEHELPPLRDRPSQPILLVHGTQDEMIPVLAARRARRVLESHGLNPEYHEFPMGHWVTEDSLRVVTDFIHRVLDAQDSNGSLR